MKKLLLTIFLTIFMCPITAQATEYRFPTDEEAAAMWEEYEQQQQAHEEYLNEMDRLTECDPSFSFADQFCKDYDIASYRELEEIYDMYWMAKYYEAEKPSQVEDAFLAEFILEDELGVETVNELRDFQEKYGYGSIDELLQAVDEIGYSEITGDYSNFPKESTQTISAVPKTKDEEESVNYGALILCGIAVLSFYLVPYFVSEHLKKKRKEKPHGINELP